MQCPFETPSKGRKLDFLDFGSPDRSIEDELHSYVNEKMAGDADPLLWWKENEGRFPKVAVVARSVLSVPATSVLRNRLTPDIVDCIIFF